MHRVETARRFVQKKQRRIVNERAAEREKLTHATGQTARRLVPLICQIDQPQNAIDALVDLARRNPMRTGEEAEVFHHGEIAIKAEALCDVAEFRAHDVPLPPDISAGDSGRATRRPRQSAEHAHGGRFASAVGAEKTEDRAPLDLEGKPTHRFEAAEAFTQIA